MLLQMLLKRMKRLVINSSQVMSSAVDRVSSLHHGQVLQAMATLFFGFVPRTQKFNLPLFGFNFIFMFLQFLFGCDVRVSNSLL